MAPMRPLLLHCCLYGRPLLLAAPAASSMRCEISLLLRRLERWRPLHSRARVHKAPAPRDAGYGAGRTRRHDAMSTTTTLVEALSAGSHTMTARRVVYVQTEGAPRAPGVRGVRPPQEFPP